jgi:hypothetical protein
MMPIGLTMKLTGEAALDPISQNCHWFPSYRQGPDNLQQDCWNAI